MNESHDRIKDKAAHWFVRAQEPGLSSAERAEFARWLSGSPDHVLEYLSFAAVSQDIRTTLPETDIDALLALARASGDAHNVVTMPSVFLDASAGPGRSRRRWGRYGIWPAAASVLVAAAVALWLVLTSGSFAHSTGIGEQSSFSLEDGSVVILNAQSTLNFDFTRSERNARLIAGEALFIVAKDEDRPFQVVTERAIIRAVGTSFNVRDRGENTTVTVVQGIVDVRPLPAFPQRMEGNARSMEAAPEPGGEAVLPRDPPDASGPVRLSVGQQGRVIGQTVEIAAVETEIEKATLWRERRLVFKNRALSEVVEEFNLYNRERMTIGDAGLASNLISGAFDADDLDSFVLFLSVTGIAVADRRPGGGFVLRVPEAIR